MNETNGRPPHARGHEQSDAEPRPIAVFEVTLVTWIVVAFGLMTGLFYYFTHRRGAAGPKSLAAGRGTAAAARAAAASAACHRHRTVAGG